MDAVEFLKMRNRICNEYEVDCDNCPIINFGICGSSADAKELVSIVEKWAKEHPVKTRQGEFLKLFPNATLVDYGAVDICPMRTDSTYHIDCIKNNCPECKKKYWLAEVE